MDQEVAPIRSQAELQEYLRVLPARSPLKFLSPVAREKFLNSLVFSRNGLASYSYKDLAIELTALEAYKVLALFGQQATVTLIPGLRQPDGFSKTIMSSAGSRAFASPGDGRCSPEASSKADYPDHACVARATCVEALGKICVGANC
ncbi:hypothetical protein ACFQS6_08195 [Xanthomonas populi]